VEVGVVAVRRLTIPVLIHIGTVGDCTGSEGARCDAAADCAGEIEEEKFITFEGHIIEQGDRNGAGRLGSRDRQCPTGMHIIYAARRGPSTGHIGDRNIER